MPDPVSPNLFQPLEVPHTYEHLTRQELQPPTQDASADSLEGSSADPSPNHESELQGLTAIMAKLFQLRVRAEELRIDTYPRMRKEELKTEIQKREQAIAAEGTPQPADLQRAHNQEVT